MIRYEDMLAKPLETFTQASHFLELPTDPERIEKAIRFSDFKVLAEQEADKEKNLVNNCSLTPVNPEQQNQ